MNECPRDAEGRLAGEARFRRMRAERRAAEPYREAQGSSAHRAHSLLRTALRMGELTQDGRLVEADLIAELGLSRSAVREALQMLASAGLVNRTTKAGTVVRSPIANVRIGEAIPDLPELGPVEIVRTDTALMPINALFRQRFDDPPRDLRCSEYLLTAGHQTLATVVEYRRDDGDVALGDSLEALPLRTVLERFHGVRSGHVETTVEAVRADAGTAQRLGIETGSPVALCETHGCDETGEPRILQFWHYRVDCVSFGARGVDLLAAGTHAEVPDVGQRSWDPALDLPAVRTVRGALINSPARVHALMRSALRTLLTTGYQVSERRLAADFGSGRNTTRAAMGILVEEGLIERRQRAGTRVVRPILSLPMSAGTLPGTFAFRAVQSRPVPSNAVVEAMIPTHQGWVYLSEQLILQGDELAGLRYEYFSTEEHLRARTTTETIRQQVLSVEVVGCDSSSAALLGVAVGSPALLHENLLVDDDGAVVGWGFTHFRGDRVASNTRVALVG